MRVQVKEHIDNCFKCLTYSDPVGKPEGQLHLYDKRTRPFETIHVDHYGPLDKTKRGLKYIFMVIDAFTKYVVMYPVKSTATKELISSLMQYFRHFGYCKRIISDRGSSLTFHEFSDLLTELKITHVKVASATPRANGQIERVNRFLRSILAKMCMDETWDKALLKAQFSINNTYHTPIGTTPSLLLFGCEQYGFIDDDLRDYLQTVLGTEIDREQLRGDAIVQNRRLQDYNKQVYDQKHKKPRVYAVGDYVMIKNVVTTAAVNHKLLPKFRGPYEVKKVLDRDRYIVGDVAGFQLTISNHRLREPLVPIG